MPKIVEILDSHLMHLPSLRSNILALGSVQAGNFLVPLLTLPYLARVLGAEGYGEVVWIQTIMAFGMILVDFGFGWSATREISARRHERSHVAVVFANTWAVQWLLVVVFATAVVYLPWVLNAENPLIYVAGLGLVFGQALLPLWLFQGLEALRMVAFIQLLGKLCCLPLLYWWVEGPNDQVKALLFFSTSAIVVGILSLSWLWLKRLVDWIKPSPQRMLKIFKEGALLFSSRALISIYTTLVPLAVGWWAGTTQLAWFNLADKIRTMLQALMTPVSQALFPRMSWLFQNDVEQAKIMLMKTALSVVSVSFFAGAIIWFGAELCMDLLGGKEFIQGAAVLRWLAFVPSIVALSTLLGVQIMLPLGMNKVFTAILGGASVVSLVFLHPMVSRSGAQGAAELVVYVECLVTGSMAIYLWRKKI